MIAHKPQSILTEQLSLGLNPPVPQHTFANYVPGTNEAVYQTLVRVVRRESENCMYLWGPTGTGKTHLLQAAMASVAENGGTPFYLPLAERDQFSAEMLEGLEELDLVCLDDIQHIVGLPDWERAVFKLFNQLRDTSTPLLIAGNNAPNALGLTLTDLVSRFSWGGVFYLEPLSEIGAREVLQSYARELGLRLPATVLNLLMRHTTHDLKTLTRWVDRIDQVSLTMKKKPNLTLVRHLLEGHFKAAS